MTASARFQHGLDHISQSFAPCRPRITLAWRWDGTMSGQALPMLAPTPEAITTGATCHQAVIVAHVKVAVSLPAVVPAAAAMRANVRH
jgi:hypothetical protein